MKASQWQSLLDWYEQNWQQRDLPWRRESTPYHVWISEIMLQQTRAKAVIPYYHRFLERLPDIASLAACPDDDLLKLWEGLGYYSRARNLKKAAQVILDSYNGRMPFSPEELAKLPGIGPYTAGAIASICFGANVPAVDGNVLRVVSRLEAIREDILLPQTKKQITELLLQTMPREKAGAFNQAMMDLGATICLPGSKALCVACPLQRFCKACQLQLTDQIPLRSGRIQRKTEQKTVLVIRDGVRFLVRKRPEKGLLAGMYELPLITGFVPEKEVLAFAQGLSLYPVRLQELPASKHIFTHLEWHMHGFLLLVEELPDNCGPFTAASRDEIEGRYAIPSAFRAYKPYIR
ncbi:MAG: A/G-specific adenine glycosylase [Lachnospiraceae bacterium]|nr:A/G-specific adenine glycosylase [Lachnospiraceae bacterium]